jgi:ATP-dependent helicase/nuclease subunit B
LGAIKEEVKFAGTIDRVDSKGGKLRIIDYKTGFVDNNKLNPKEWEKLFSDPSYSKAFQLMMYAWIYEKKHPQMQEMQAGIISLRMPGKGPALVKSPEKKQLNNSLLLEFEEKLRELVEEIFNTSIPFSQTEDESRCKYCSFNEICNRISYNDNF